MKKNQAMDSEIEQVAAEPEMRAHYSFKGGQRGVSYSVPCYARRTRDAGGYIRADWRSRPMGKRLSVGAGRSCWFGIRPDFNRPLA